MFSWTWMIRWNFFKAGSREIWDDWKKTNCLITQFCPETKQTGKLEMENGKVQVQSPPYTKQYPISHTSRVGIIPFPVIKQLEVKGVSNWTKWECFSYCPVWPVSKANCTWRLTIDYRMAQQHIEKLPPLTADPSTMHWRELKSVIDMTNGF